MPDAPASARLRWQLFPRWIARLNAFVAIGLVTMVSSLAIALRIFERDEIWHERTYWIIGIATVGGLVGAIAGRFAGMILPSARIRRYPRLAAATVFGLFFVGGMALGFTANILIFEGQFEPNPDRLIRAWIMSSLQVIFLFLASCPAYLLPWPLPVMMAAAALLLPAGEKPVEPADDGV